MPILFKDHNTILFKEEFTRILNFKSNIYHVHKSAYIQRAKVHRHKVKIDAYTTCKSTQTQHTNRRMHHVQKYADTTYKRTQTQRANQRTHNVQIDA